MFNCSDFYISYLFNCSYYINHYTKTTSWEDPRERYKEIGKPTGKDNKENEVQANTFSYFQKSTNSSWRWCLSQTYKWQACEGSLRPNSQASGIKVFSNADSQKVDNWSVAHILDLIVDQNLNSRSGSGDKSGPSRGVNHGATSPSTGRVITPQVGKVGLVLLKLKI